MKKFKDISKIKCEDWDCLECPAYMSKDCVMYDFEKTFKCIMEKINFNKKIAKEKLKKSDEK